MAAEKQPLQDPEVKEVLMKFKEWCRVYVHRIAGWIDTNDIESLEKHMDKLDKIENELKGSEQ